jgi:hypothetical protein
VRRILASGLDGAWVSFAQQGLELGEDLVGRITRQAEQFGAGGADQASGGLAFVTAQMDVTRHLESENPI